MIETYDLNEPVFLRLAVKKPSYEICDSLERHLPEKCSQYDNEYVSESAKVIAADRLQNA